MTAVGDVVQHDARAVAAARVLDALDVRGNAGAARRVDGAAVERGPAAHRLRHAVGPRRAGDEPLVVVREDVDRVEPAVDRDDRHGARRAALDRLRRRVARARSAHAHHRRDRGDAVGEVAAELRRHAPAPRRARGVDARLVDADGLRNRVDRERDERDVVERIGRRVDGGADERNARDVPREARDARSRREGHGAGRRGDGIAVLVGVGGEHRTPVRAGGRHRLLAGRPRAVEPEEQRHGRAVVAGRHPELERPVDAALRDVDRVQAGDASAAQPAVVREASADARTSPPSRSSCAHPEVAATASAARPSCTRRARIVPYLGSRERVRAHLRARRTRPRLDPICILDRRRSR
ncbi:MAG: hypothetical protein R3E88_01840 [Myxococcota bacterium]